MRKNANGLPSAAKLSREDALTETAVLKLVMPIAGVIIPVIGLVV